ncbi:hypothetical protein GJ496_007320 [Pomphorhynchus laevis]|nr:hypothetical protein GJ496_007320 [Pomphorhynchus laevis]
MTRYILWSPKHDDYFATVSEEAVKVYSILSQDNCEIFGRIEFTENVLPVVAWQSSLDNPYVFACVEHKGKISIQSADIRGFDKSHVSSFSLPEGASSGSATKLHERDCLQLCWNQYHTTMLTGVFSSFRNEPSVYIWDIVNTYSDEAAGDIKRSNGSSTMPFYEIGNGERIDSFAWVHCERSVFAVTSYKKGVKLYDIRAGRQPTLVSSPSKYSFNLCTRPDHDYHITTTCNNEVCLWDVRKFEEPSYLMKVCCPSAAIDVEAILKIEWMPNSNGKMLTILINGYLHLLETIEYNVTEEIRDSSNELIFYPRILSSLSDKKLCKIACFANSRYIKNGVVAYSQKYSKLILDIEMISSNIVDICPNTCNMALFDSTKHTLSIAKPSVKLQNHVDEELNFLKFRLSSGYGMQDMGFPHCNTDKDVREFWDWIKSMESINKRDLQSEKSTKYMGIKQSLKIIPGHNDVPSDYKSVETTRNIGPRPYRFPERLKSIMICGWCHQYDCESVNSYFERFKNSGEDIERVAVVAMLHGYFERGIEILTTSGRSELLSAAAALSGVANSSIENKPNMIQILEALLKNDTSLHPYLRLAYNFAMNEDPSLSYIETIDGLKLVDIIGFACRFYNDTLLTELIDAICRNASRLGQLNALCITGFTSEGLDIIQAYINRTHDLQTAALIAVLFSTRSPTSFFVISESNSMMTKEQLKLSNWIESKVRRPSTLSRTKRSVSFLSNFSGYEDDAKF